MSVERSVCYANRVVAVLGHDFMDDITVYVGESEVTTIMLERELLVIQSKQV